VWTADIDVGGTLTDGVFSDGERLVSVKVDTTPHDLTVCLFDCLGQGAAALGFADTADFLDQIELIRWSTTITSNVLAELQGPRIGLLVSRGHERDLYGKDPRSIVFDRLIAEKDVIGIAETAVESDIMLAARSLLESGVRRICVSIEGAHLNTEREISIKRTIDQQYPDHFLGSVPVLAGSDIARIADDQTRTYCALINAYTHGALAATLFKAEDELRETARYAGTFLVSHINGGAAGIAKTRAIDTIESGPILGIQGSAFMAKAYAARDLIAMDIGGTTAKISLLRDGEPIYRKPSDFFGIPVDMRLPDLHSIALGGGSVVKAGVAGGDVQLGPESMGSYPGPACYGLGGDQPTLTDAFVTAGLINPDHFLGGTKPIDRELASKSIEDLVARPLRITADEACRKIIGRAFDSVASLIAGAASGRATPERTLFAYGGNGGLFACGVAEKTKIDVVRVFELGAVFSAFGSSVSDISHVYQHPFPGLESSDDAVLRVRLLIDDMKAEAVKDLLGEGVRPDHVVHSIELDVSVNGRDSVVVPCDESFFRGTSELWTGLSHSLGLPPEPRGKISVELVRLKARKPVSKPRLVERPLQGPDSSHARIGSRKILWGITGGQADVYRWESLQPGNRVEGCAVIEGMNTTYFVPEGWILAVDRFGNGALSRRLA
jgi:acetophenone carboxylase